MKIKYTKRGQPYTILANGRAKFLKKGKRGKSRKITVLRAANIKKRSYRMVKRKTKRAAPKRDMFSILKNPIIGSAGVVAYEAFLSPMIPVQGMAKDVLELVAGTWLAKKGGVIGATGRTLVALNSYQLVSGLANNIKSGGIMSIFGSTGTQQSSGVYVY